MDLVLFDARRRGRLRSRHDVVLIIFSSFYRVVVLLCPSGYTLLTQSWITQELYAN